MTKAQMTVLFFWMWPVWPKTFCSVGNEPGTWNLIPVKLLQKSHYMHGQEPEPMDSAKCVCGGGGESGTFRPQTISPLVVSPPRRFPPGRFPTSRFAP